MTAMRHGLEVEWHHPVFAPCAILGRECIPAAPGDPNAIWVRLTLTARQHGRHLTPIFLMVRWDRLAKRIDRSGYVQHAQRGIMRTPTVMIEGNVRDLAETMALAEHERRNMNGDVR